MRLYLFSSGYISCERSVFVVDGGNKRVHVPTPFYLIKHNGKNILFDTGNAASYIGKTVNEERGEAGVVMSGKEWAPNAIESAGVTREQIDIVILSHLHSDHVGTADQFPNATIIVRRKEYDYAIRPDYFMTRVYSVFNDMPDLDYYFIKGDEAFDVFGDGCLVLISTPGHTPGHQSLILQTQESGIIVLTADACYTSQNLDQSLLPSDLVCDRTSYLSQISRFRLYEKTGAMIITGHDADGWETYRHAPNFYE